MMECKYWVPHKHDIFTPGYIVEEGEKTTAFKCDNGDVVEVPTKTVANMGTVHDDHLKGVPNIVSMDSISSGAILSTLETRFARDEIYTKQIVIAVNPFQNLNIYSSEHVDIYAKAADTTELPPHIYAIGANAIQGLFDYGKNQAVLISGESGAGKTESTKSVLAYIADVAGSHTGIQNKILNTNPVLEAFGNAKTERNNNSSRFGKWIEVKFDPNMAIMGASVTDYLLEVTRVLSQNELERSYHIFYYLMYGDKAKEYDLKPDNKAYRMMNMSCPTADGINDSEDFCNLHYAFEGLNFTEKEETDLYKICAGLMHMSNVCFENAMVNGGEGCEVTDKGACAKAAKFLGIDEKQLSDAFTFKKLVVGKDITMAPQQEGKAEIAKQVLSKLLYGKMFSWLVKRMNETLKVENEIRRRTVDKGDAKLLARISSANELKRIGILDIAGFESFVFNTFEQLCINLSNECLQQFFNDFVFKTEMADYIAEGVSIEKIEFADNEDILELIQGKTGLMSMLDQELAVPKATNVTYVTKITKAFNTHKRFIGMKHNDAIEFSLEHYAGVVKYNADGWLEKNSDNPPVGAGAILSQSDNHVIQMIGQELVSHEGNARGPKKKKTVSSTFRESLAHLMEQIRKSQPHFIRCIKPNKEKAPSIFTPNMVFEQLTYSGALEAVKIRQAGYPLRMTVRDFLGRYGATFPPSLKIEVKKATGNKPLSDPECLKMIFQKLPALFGDKGLVSTDFALGKTKVFCKVNAQRALDNARRFALQGICATIQRYYRGFIARKKVSASKKLMKEIKKFFEAHPLYIDAGSNGVAIFGSVEKLQKQKEAGNKTLAQAQKLTPVPPNSRKYEVLVNKMEEELAIHGKKEELLLSVDSMLIENTIAELQRLKYSSDCSLLKQLQSRAQRIAIQTPIFKALKALPVEKDAIETTDSKTIVQFQNVLQICKESGLSADNENEWIDKTVFPIFTKAVEMLKAVEAQIDKDKQEEITIRQINQDYKLSKF